MPDTVPPRPRTTQPTAAPRWLEAVAAGASVGVAGDVGEDLVLALRGLRGARVAFVGLPAADEEAEPPRGDFDVVVVGVDESEDGRDLHLGRTLLRPGGTLVVVLGGAQEAPAPPPGNGTAGRELDALRGQLALAQGRRAAVLDELVACERALSTAEERAERIHEEIIEMRRTLSWRVTRPLRWARARAAQR